MQEFDETFETEADEPIDNPAEGAEASPDFDRDLKETREEETGQLAATAPGGGNVAEGFPEARKSGGPGDGDKTYETVISLVRIVQQLQELANQSNFQADTAGALVARIERLESQMANMQPTH